MQKIYDTFLFNNELDLLEIRINILWDHVDYFVIVEANETFTGIKKPLYFLENFERFKKWESKIIHFVVDNADEDLWEYSRKSPNVGSGENHQWVREFYQKENILKAFAANDEDIIFVSDLDEIWNPSIFNINDTDFGRGQVYRPIQTAYHYFLNNRSNQDINGWVGTRFGKYSVLKENGVNYFRTEKIVPSIEIKRGGWHFTNIGSPDFIKNKLESYSHQEYNGSSTIELIREAINTNVDFLNRGFRLWKDESDLPDFIIQEKEKYKHLFL